MSVPVKELVVSEGTIRPPLRDRSSLDRFTEQLENGGSGRIRHISSAQGLYVSQITRGSRRLYTSNGFMDPATFSHAKLRSRIVASMRKQR